MKFNIRNFYGEDLSLFNKDLISNKIILSIYSIFPVFLIIGTAVSELAMILIFFYFIYNYVFERKNIFKDKIYIGLLIIYLSLLINLIFSSNISNSFMRNIFFIKYIIFVLGTISFISDKKFRLSFVYKSWAIILTIFAIDMLVQFFFGKNIIGMESPLKFHRVSGFMGDELRAGSLLVSLSLIVSCFLINNKKYKNIGIFLIIVFIFAIFISGDRSNFLKSLLVTSLILFFLNKELIKKILLLLIFLFVLIFSIISNYETLGLRYKSDLFSKLVLNNYNILNFVKSTEYGKIYHTGIVVFQNNKLFGVGNKNFRLLCKENEIEKFLIKNKIDYKKNYVVEKFSENFRCNTHPHQIYIEILSEHGIFGFGILLTLLGIFIKQNILIILRKKNILLGCQFLIILINFIPILPGGSFFSSFNASIFWINIALFYSYKKIIS